MLLLSDTRSMYFVDNNAKEHSASDGSASESESVLDFEQLVSDGEESEEEEEDEEEQEVDKREQEEDGGEEQEHDEEAHADSADDVPRLPDNVLTRIVPLIQRQVGYVCDLIYDPQHNILHISVPQGVVATWQVRKNMIQCLYSSLPLLRELLDQGALEISFTRGTRTLIEQSAEELSNKDPQPSRSTRKRARDPHSGNEEVSREESCPMDQASDESRDSAAKDVSQDKSRALKEIDFFADSESRDRHNHVAVSTHGGMPLDYRGNLTRIEERIAQYKEQWFSEKKPLDDYDTWERLQDSEERIRAELARLNAVSVKSRLARAVLTRGCHDSKCRASQTSWQGCTTARRVCRMHVTDTCRHWCSSCVPWRTSSDSRPWSMHRQGVRLIPCCLSVATYVT